MTFLGSYESRSTLRIMLGGEAILVTTQDLGRPSPQPAANGEREIISDIQQFPPNPQTHRSLCAAQALLTSTAGDRS